MNKNYVSLLMITLATSSSFLGCSSDGDDPSGTGGVTNTGGTVATGGNNSGTGGGTVTGGTNAGTGGTDAATGGTGGGTGGDGTGGDGTGGDEATAADFEVIMIEGEPVITNEEGFVLYTFASDTKGGEGTGVNNAWPAVKVTAPPSVGPGLDAGDFGVTPLGQSTYDGWPLYTFANDTAPGEATGESSAWPLARPLP